MPPRVDSPSPDPVDALSDIYSFLLARRAARLAKQRGEIKQDDRVSPDAPTREQQGEGEADREKF